MYGDNEPESDNKVTFREEHEVSHCIRGTYTHVQRQRKAGADLENSKGEFYLVKIIIN